MLHDSAFASKPPMGWHGHDMPHAAISMSDLDYMQYAWVMCSS